MGLTECFEIKEEHRLKLIDENILSFVPEKERKGIKERVVKLVNNYVGRDSDAISVLMYAAEQGKLEKYIGKLEEHYKEHLAYIYPEARRIAKVQAAIRTEAFIIGCYKEMGIKPRK